MGDSIVYCQYCDKDLTQIGGDVTGSGRIYCHGFDGLQDACGMKAMIKGIEGKTIILNHYDPTRVQEAIRKGELRQFSPLERSVLERSS